MTVRFLAEPEDCFLVKLRHQVILEYIQTEDTYWVRWPGLGEFGCGLTVKSATDDLFLLVFKLRHLLRRYRPFLDRNHLFELAVMNEAIDDD